MNNDKALKEMTMTTQMAADVTPCNGAPGSQPAGPTRRSFLKWSGVAAGTATLVASTTNLGMPGNSANAAEVEGMADVDKTVWSACTVNCGSRCPLRLQVKNGTIVRVLPDNTGDNELGSQRVRSCVRGRAIRHRIYNPNRLKKPLKRKAGTKRGDGQWEEISWDQALTEIADKMKDIKSQYGNEAIYINYGTGVLGTTMATSWPPENSAFARMMNCWGGYLDHYGTYSSAEISYATPFHYGAATSSNSLDDAANAKLQVMFGNNPLETRMSGGGLTFISQQTKKKSNVKTIIIDPRLSETGVALGDEWIAIRPGTDAALVAAMVHVMLEENLHDQDFLDKYCVGFDEDHMPAGAPAGASYRAYVEGKGPDGIEKTPDWAADITGIPAGTIRRLAREIALAKPCAITQGYGPQRQANGEDAARSIMTLATVTGNVGIPGGGTGCREGSAGLKITKTFGTTTKNPSNKIISVFSWLDAIEHGPQMDTFNSGVCEKSAPGVRAPKIAVDKEGNATNIKLDVPIKMVWQYGGNSIVNQTGDNNESIKILQDETKCELIVDCDLHMVASARYADYVLPGTSTAEEFDLHPGENASPMAYGIVSTQAIEPLYECRSIFDICTDLADKLGVKDAYLDGKDREGWLRDAIETSRKDDPSLPDYDTWKEMGLFRKAAGAVVALKDFRQDPEANPLKTPSGKIEIYSQRLATLAEKWTFDEFRPQLLGDQLNALPEYTETWEGPMEARTSKKYPLQLIGHHFKARTHSSYGHVDWLEEAHTQTVWINPIDADARGIKNDDDVFIYNDRGTVKVPARVTERIAPGVVSLPQGAWFDPKPTSEVKPPKGANPDHPVDVGSNTNTLTSLHPSPLAKGNAVHTTIVQVVKA